MTMGSEEELFSSLALPVVIQPILDRLAEKDGMAARSLKNSFNKMEATNPGFSFQLVGAVLRRAGVEGRVDIAESILRMEANNHSDEFLIDRADEVVISLNERSTNLKKTLSRIPDEIYDRKRFLETIKDIASAIRLLLDSLNSVLPLANDASRHRLEGHKKDFVKYSRIFSNTLKDFFKDNEKRAVFISGNHLINQCNLLMRTTKEALA